MPTTTVETKYVKSIGGMTGLKSFIAQGITKRVEEWKNLSKETFLELVVVDNIWDNFQVFESTDELNENMMADIKKKKIEERGMKTKKIQREDTVTVNLTLEKKRNIFKRKKPSVDVMDLSDSLDCFD